MCGSPSLAAAAGVGRSRTRGPSSASRPSPRPLGFFVAIGGLSLIDLVRSRRGRAGSRLRRYARRSPTRHRHEHPRLRRRPGRHDRPAHPRVPRAAQRRRGAARRARAAQGHGRARAPAQCRRRRLPLPARCRGARGGGAGHQSRPPASSTRAPRTAPPATGSSACPSWRRTSASRLRASKRIANPGCHCHRLHPAAAPAGRCRPDRRSRRRSRRRRSPAIRAAARR